MTEAPRGLSRERVLEQLRTRAFGRSLRVQEETESTMDDAREDAAAGVAEGHVVAADHQRRGRGSHGRVWSSPAGQDLYFSLVTRPPLQLAELPPLTLAIGLAVSDALRHAAPGAPDGRVQIKWPNDVWLDGKKCSGILVETRALGQGPPAVIVGVGINVTRTRFEPDLAPLCTSLRLGLGREVERESLLAQVLLAMEQRVDEFVQQGAAPIARQVDERLLFRGQRVACDDVEGTLLGVAPSGALRLVDTSGATRTLVAGRLRALAPTAQ